MFYINETGVKAGTPINQKNILAFEEDEAGLAVVYYKDGAEAARFEPTPSDLEALAIILKAVRKGRRK